MPKAANPEPYTRRSSRLQSARSQRPAPRSALRSVHPARPAAAAKSAAIAELDGLARRRAPDDRTPGPSTACPDEPPACAPPPDPRRSVRITPGDLAQRERALAQLELRCKRRAAELDARCASVCRKEEQAARVLAQLHDREARAALAQLEEHFTCALCYEVMAHPYTLNPGQCGHTFCALCILKWFFSRLHRLCGCWHESVDCPICRSLLVITPERAPRLDITFPFVPNRTAGAVLEDLIGRLAAHPAPAPDPPRASPVVKEEDTKDSAVTEAAVKEEEGGGAWRSALGEGSEAAAKKVKAEDSEEMSGVAGWREGGATRLEWQKKDRDGRREMSNLIRSWTTMMPHEFASLKLKLGV